MYKKFNIGDKVKLSVNYVYKGAIPNVTYTVSDYYIYQLLHIVKIKELYNFYDDNVSFNADYFEFDIKYLRKQKIKEICTKEEQK